jgi:hypothetical protein
MKNNMVLIIKILNQVILIFFQNSELNEYKNYIISCKEKSYSKPKVIYNYRTSMVIVFQDSISKKRLRDDHSQDDNDLLKTHKR